MTIKNKFNQPEASSELTADSDLIAYREAKEKEKLERWKRMDEEQKPLLDELKSVGISIDSLSSLYKEKPYPQAIPILLKHLQLPYSDSLHEWIARSLGVKEAQYAWSILVEDYKKTQEGWGIKGPGDTEALRLEQKMVWRWRCLTSSLPRHWGN